MYFSDIVNAALSNENDRPLMQKEIYPLSDSFQKYLEKYGRDIGLPISYSELFHYSHTNSIKDKNGKPTHWENVVYEEKLFSKLAPKLVAAYHLLYPNEAKTNLEITAIDFCEYANSMPFRVTISFNAKNPNKIFYIKSADASRIYGLELEQLISPNKVDFFYHQQTLVEAHIEGIPGDIFLENAMNISTKERFQLAREFVKFNERCFTRLLGDMRSYNFVVTKNNGDVGFRIRAIDFDQQSYEGRANLYLPQFYKENFDYVQLVNKTISKKEIEEIRIQERKSLAKLVEENDHRIMELFDVMVKEELSENYKILSLRKELNNIFSTHRYSLCKTMGSIVKEHLKHILQMSLQDS